MFRNRRNDWRRINARVLGLLFPLATPGCGLVEVSSDSESHFLQLCVAAADCGAGVGCLRGVCTVTCERDAECSGLNHAASCETANTADTSLHNVCDVECASSEYCAAQLGSEALCSAGRCRAPSQDGLLQVTAAQGGQAGNADEPAAIANGAGATDETNATGGATAVGGQVGSADELTAIANGAGATDEASATGGATAMGGQAGAIDDALRTSDASGSSETAMPANCVDPVCVPGETDAEEQACGACGGTQTREAVCSDACEWEWGQWGGCVDDAVCEPGATETQEVTCPCDSTETKTQLRVCDAGCAWGDWIDTSSCDLECCSDVVYCNTQAADADLRAQYPERGTWCQPTDEDCSQAEMVEDCVTDAEAVCGGVTPEIYVGIPPASD